MYRKYIIQINIYIDYYDIIEQKVIKGIDQLSMSYFKEICISLMMIYLSTLFNKSL